jgi:hypothetical protein
MCARLPSETSSTTVTKPLFVLDLLERFEDAFNFDAGVSSLLVCVTAVLSSWFESILPSPSSGVTGLLSESSA